MLDQKPRLLHLKVARREDSFDHWTLRVLGWSLGTENAAPVWPALWQLRCSRIMPCDQVPEQSLAKRPSGSDSPEGPQGPKRLSQFALQAVVGWGKTSPIRLQIDSVYQPELLGLGVGKTGVWCGTINLNFGDITSKQQKGLSNLTIATHIHKPLLWKPFPIQSFLLNASPTSVQLTWKRVLALVLNSSKRNYWAAQDGLELPSLGKASGGQALPKTTAPAACSESGGFSLPWSTPSWFRAACDYSNLCTRKKPNI